MKVTEVSAGMFMLKHGTFKEDAAIIARAPTLLVERCPEALSEFERGMLLQYGNKAMPADPSIKEKS